MSRNERIVFFLFIADFVTSPLTDDDNTLPPNIRDLGIHKFARTLLIICMLMGLSSGLCPML